MKFGVPATYYEIRDKLENKIPLSPYEQKIISLLIREEYEKNKIIKLNNKKNFINLSNQNEKLDRKIILWKIISSILAISLIFFIIF